MKFKIDFFEYHHNDSIIHNFNCTFKFLIVLLFIISTIIFNNTYFLILILSLIITGFYLAQFNIKTAFKDIKFLIIFYFISVIIHLLLGNSSIVLKITKIFCKLVIIFLILNLFIRTTSFKKILFSFRKVIQYKYIFLFMIAIRFIPLLLLNLSEIYHIQKIRQGKIKFIDLFNFKKMMGFLIPVFTFSISLAENISMAAYAKGLCYKDTRKYLQEYYQKINHKSNMKSENKKDI